MKKTGIFLFTLVICLALAGCSLMEARKAPPPPEVQMPEFILHHAFPGETLASIAKWYTGEASKWKELAQYNPDLNPWNLKRWDIVKIPLRMATAHNYPPDFSTAPQKPRKKTQKIPAAQDSGPTESEEFFGPR